MKIKLDLSETHPDDRDQYRELARIARRLQKAHAEDLNVFCNTIRGSQRSGSHQGYCYWAGKFQGHVVLRVRDWLSKGLLRDVYDIKAKEGRWSEKPIGRAYGIGLLCHEMAHLIEKHHGYAHIGATADFLTDCVTWGYVTREEADKHTF